MVQVHESLQMLQQDHIAKHSCSNRDFILTEAVLQAHQTYRLYVSRMPHMMPAIMHYCHWLMTAGHCNMNV